MEITKETVDTMRRHPAVIGLASVLIFPLGLWLVWTHPTWSKQSKWIWTGAIAFVVLIFFATGEDQSASNASGGQASNVATTGGGGSSAGTHAVGKPFVLGNYRYTIAGVRFTPQIGKFVFGTFMGKRAAPGATLAVVTYTIENIANETQTVLTDDFTLSDSAGRTYRPSTDANVALLQESDDKDFIFSQLQPGVPRRMRQAFEIPQEAAESRLSVTIPEKGMWASGKAVIVVKPAADSP